MSRSCIGCDRSCITPLWYGAETSCVAHCHCGLEVGRFLRINLELLIPLFTRWHRPRILLAWNMRRGPSNPEPIKRLPCKIRGSNPGPTKTLCARGAQKIHRLHARLPHGTFMWYDGQQLDRPKKMDDGQTVWRWYINTKRYAQCKTYLFYHIMYQACVDLHTPPQHPVGHR